MYIIYVHNMCIYILYLYIQSSVHKRGTLESWWYSGMGHHGGKKWYVYIYIGNADLVGGSDVLEMFPLLRWFTFSKWWLFMAMWLCLITKGNIDIMHPMLKNPSPVGYTSAVVVSLIWVRPKIRYPCFFQDLSSLLVVGSTEPHSGLCQPGWDNLFSPGLTLYGKDISIKQK